nr:hypothetical protein [Tanacetum cinerariifolium]
RLLMAYISNNLRGNIGSKEELNYMHQLIVHGLINGVKLDYGGIIFNDLAAMLTHFVRHTSPTYARFISLILEKAVADSYVLSDEIFLKIPIMGNSSFSLKPSLLEVPISSHMVCVCKFEHDHAVKSWNLKMLLVYCCFDNVFRRLFISAIADLLSTLIVTFYSSKCVRLLSSLFNHNDCVVVDVAAMNSDSHDDNATVACFLCTPAEWYAHLSTIPEIESDEVTESSVKKLVPILSEYEVTSDKERECDVPVCEDSSTFDVCKDHSKILSDSNNDDISSDDDAFEDIEYVEASFPNSELVSLEEENDVYQEDEDLTPNRVFKSSASFPIFEESNNYLSYSNNSSPEFETFSDHTKETKSDSTITHANNSFPVYDSFCFEIESDQGRLTSIVKNDISDDSTNDPLLEESSNFDHDDDPFFPRPPPEPPFVEFFFDFEPNSREVISAMMKNIDELNEDECFDLRGEIDVFANVEDDDYFPFIFFIRIFLPYLIYPEVSLLLLSIGSEDPIFYPGIST